MADHPAGAPLGCTLRISRKTIVALALSAPLVCAAAEPTLLVGGPGNQTAPSMSPPYLAYVDDAAGAPDLFLKDLGTGALTRVTADGLAVGGPDVAGGFLSYRRDGWVEVFNVRTGLALPSIAAPGSGRVSVSPTVVAWEQGGPGSGDVGWKRLASVSAAVLQAPAGDQHAVATAFGWVAWIDDAAGAVLLADSTPGAGDPQAIFTVAEAGGATTAPDASWSLTDALLAKGYAVVELDARAMGEDDYVDCAALVFGRPLVGMVAYDVTRMMDYLPGQPGVDATKVTLWADGPAAMAGLYAGD